MPAIRVSRVDYGPFPGAPQLNPRLSATSPLLFATIEIRWEPRDPAGRIEKLERSLLAISPRFRHHECRGPDAYHVFRGDARAAVPRAHGKRPPPGAGTIDGRLALAHLIEHAVIDFQCAINGARRCSGVTAAYRGRKDLFDLMVECPDRRVGRACLGLALAWITAALEGQDTGPAEKEILAAARFAWDHRDSPLTSLAAARALTCPEERAAHALAALRDVGYLRETPWSVNLSGLPFYRLAEA